MTRLSNVDLNLLSAFEALWIERNVTRAGRRLGLSQPAMSGALSRLRAMLGDPLFVRARTGLMPTERCAELALPLSKALLDIRHALAGRTFEPRTTERQLHLGGVDAALAVVAPEVAARFIREAPRAQLVITAIDPTRAVDLIEAGTLDVALTPKARDSATVKQRALFPVRFLVSMRPGHPLARKKLTMPLLAARPRVQINFAGPPSSGGLLAGGSVVVSSFLAATHLLTVGDAWAMLPAPLARKLEKMGTLVARAPPPGIPQPDLTMKMIWPEAQDAAPASRFLRALILDAVAALAPA